MFLTRKGKNLIAGAGSILNIFPSDEINYECLPEVYSNERDELSKDWQNVGNDYWNSINKIVTQEKKSIIGSKKYRKIEVQSLNDRIKSSKKRSKRNSVFIVRVNKNGVSIELAGGAD